MSYVLEALKKAEAQKDPGARTALVQERREYRRNRWWQILVASALLANLFVLLWLFYPRSETGAPADPVPAQQPALAESSPHTQVTPAQSFQQPQALQQP
ncbi:MAG: hypothetical protein KDI31_05940, partial [Pseudomonadales bacterium]|nr:hypothetical protein [Pseudomonadales bacterium]